MKSTTKPVEKDKVVFRVFKEGDVIAMFPEHSWRRNGKTVCYQHMGGHGEESYHAIIRMTKPATEEQYLPLLNELKPIGYNPLVIEKAKIRFKD